MPANHTVAFQVHQAQEAAQLQQLLLPHDRYLLESLSLRHKVQAGVVVTQKQEVLRRCKMDEAAKLMFCKVDYQASGESLRVCYWLLEY